MANTSTSSLVDAIPARNGIWDTQKSEGLDKVALHGFTIDELVDLGALAATTEEENSQPNNLRGHVHPIFFRERWETSLPSYFVRKNMFRLGAGSNGAVRSGMHAASNKLVWRALLPCLRLASKFVENSHIFPWYNAFIHSDPHTINKVTSKSTTAQKLYIPRQSDMTTPAMIEATRQKILSLAKSITLGISDGNADPTGRQPQLKIQYDGVTMVPNAKTGNENRGYRIYIAYQIVEPLLNGDIGPSTRLALQFHVALTLLHEFAHVLEWEKGAGTKLYLDNERISEAGYSCEMNIFGGHPVLLVERADNAPLRAGFILEDWLGTAKGVQLNESIIGTDADWNDEEWREARSIPYSFLEELGQEDFWTHFVAVWGAEALKIYPWTEGRLVQRVGNALQTQIYSTQKPDPAWLMAMRKASETKSASLMPQETIVLQIANRRLACAREISIRVRARRRLEGKRNPKPGVTQPAAAAQEIKLPTKTTQKHDQAPQATGPKIKTPKAATPQVTIPPMMTAAQSGNRSPWETRNENITTMKEQLEDQIFETIQEDARVKAFLARKDVGSPEYLAVRKILMDTSRVERKRYRALYIDSFDAQLLNGYENILQSYEEMKDALGRDSRDPSIDQEDDDISFAVENLCTTLLARATACRNRGEHKRCFDYCKEVLSTPDLVLESKAHALLLCGLSTTENEWEVWYLSEAVRVYKIMEHLERESPVPNTTRNRQLVELRLTDAIRQATRTPSGVSQASSASVTPASTDVQPSTVQAPEKLPGAAAAITAGAGPATAQTPKELSTGSLNAPGSSKQDPIKIVKGHKTPPPPTGKPPKSSTSKNLPPSISQIVKGYKTPPPPTGKPPKSSTSKTSTSTTSETLTPSTLNAPAPSTSKTEKPFTFNTPVQLTIKAQNPLTFKPPESPKSSEVFIPSFTSPKPFKSFLDSTTSQGFGSSEDSEPSKTSELSNPSKTSKSSKTSKPSEQFKPWTGFGKPPIEFLTPIGESDSAPEGMSPEEVIRHQRTYKVINQARRNFLEGDINLAERGFLELLQLRSTNIWQKARCHFFLSLIKRRPDRVARAQTALRIFRRFLARYPDDANSIDAVRTTGMTLTRILSEIEWEKAVTWNAKTKKAKFVTSSSLHYNPSGPDAVAQVGAAAPPGWKEMIDEVEEEVGDDDGTEIEYEIDEEGELHVLPVKKKGEEQVGFVAGLWGFFTGGGGGKKRARDEDNDGEDRGAGGNKRGKH